MLNSLANYTPARVSATKIELQGFSLVTPVPFAETINIHRSVELKLMLNRSVYDPATEFPHSFSSVVNLRK